MNNTKFDRQPPLEAARVVVCIVGRERGACRKWREGAGTDGSRVADTWTSNYGLGWGSFAERVAGKVSGFQGDEGTIEFPLGHQNQKSGFPTLQASLSWVNQSRI